jgi:predicted nucleic acid-binding protein
VKIYWDTSAIVWFYSRGRMAEIAGLTRPHSLSETFSTLTGRGFDVVRSDGTKRHTRLSLRSAEEVIRKIHPRLQYVELSADEIVAALKEAPAKSAQGGRVHDLMHAVAAEKCGADELWTLDQNDFIGLGKVPIKTQHIGWVAESRSLRFSCFSSSESRA